MRFERKRSFWIDKECLNFCRNIYLHFAVRNYIWNENYNLWVLTNTSSALICLFVTYIISYESSKKLRYRKLFNLIRLSTNHLSRHFAINTKQIHNPIYAKRSKYMLPDITSIVSSSRIVFMSTVSSYLLQTCLLPR